MLVGAITPVIAVSPGHFPIRDVKISPDPFGLLDSHAVRQRRDRDPSRRFVLFVAGLRNLALGHRGETSRRGGRGCFRSIGQPVGTLRMLPLAVSDFRARLRTRVRCRRPAAFRSRGISAFEQGFGRIARFGHLLDLPLVRGGQSSTGLRTAVDHGNARRDPAARLGIGFRGS